MSDENQSKDENPLQFYLTPAHQCPYLEKEESKTLFLNPEVLANDAIYSWLIDQGFRRSGEHIYRPHCEECKACISVRINVNKFKPNKQQKRTARVGSKFTTRVSQAKFDLKRYQLFESYINDRHKDGDMYPTSESKYQDFIFSENINTQFLDFIDPNKGKLFATCVFDQATNGLSAVYTFFDKDYEPLESVAVQKR